MTRPTIIGGPFPLLNSGALGTDPDADLGDEPDPVDLATGAEMYFPFGLIEGADIVQEVDNTNTNVDGTIAVTFGSGPSQGNLLVAVYNARDAAPAPGVTSGWTGIPTISGEATADGQGGNNGRVVMFYKVAGASESTTLTITKNGSYYARLWAAEIAGSWTLDDTDSTNVTTLETSLSAGSVTPTGAEAFMVGTIIQSHASTLTIGGSFTERDNALTYSAFSPRIITGTRYVDGPAGSYSMTASSGTADSYAGILAAFERDLELYWLTSQSMNDSSDATYESILSGAITSASLVVARIVYPEARRFGSARLRIALDTAGSVTYTLKGTNEPDFTSAVTLAAVTFTGTGSFTAQDVDFSWVQTTGYRYYVLVASAADDLRIHSLEMFEAAEGVSDHPSLTDRDAADQHPASAVTFTPAGTIAATNVQDAIEEVASEAGSSAFAGQPLVVTIASFSTLSNNTNNLAGLGGAFPVIVPAAMKLRAAHFNCSATGTGTVQWGLFDYSANPASATKLAGGSGAISGTNWFAIAAASAPVDIAAGAYMFVFHSPSSNAPTFRCMLSTSNSPFMQFWSAYSWDDTPDFTSASWAANATTPLIYLEGDLDGSGNRWT